MQDYVVADNGFFFFPVKLSSIGVKHWLAVSSLLSCSELAMSEAYM